jgi:exopolysaccharide biosynthesis polyprenyl glycosylphosphotransferase
LEASRSDRTKPHLRPAGGTESSASAGAPGTTIEVAEADRSPSVVATTWGRRDALTRRLLAAADLVGLLGALTAASAIVGTSQGTRDAEFDLLVASLPTLPVWLVLFKLYGLYDRDIKRVSHATFDDLPWLFHALLIGGLLLWGYFKLLPVHQLTFAESVVFGISALATISLLRALVRRMVIGALGPERVLIAGSGGMSTPLIRKMRQHPEYALEPIGMISPTIGRPSQAPLPVLGSPQELERVAGTVAAERLVICRRDFEEDQVLDMIEGCRRLSLKVSLLPAIFDALGPSVEIDEVEGLTVLGVNPPILGRTSRLIKRSFDLVIASAALFVLLPVMALVALAIKLESRGPVLFRQERIGRGGRRFALLKFRTMVTDAESRRAELLERSADPNWLHIAHDPRVTRIGRLLRMTSLDELPQLWNVVKGDMSLVGPRPLIEEEDRRVGGWMRGRLDLMPGITGMWQVLGRTNIPFEEMVKLDYLYVTNWSLWLDVKLLVRTLPAVLSRRGAN